MHEEFELHEWQDLYDKGLLPEDDEVEDLDELELHEWQDLYDKGLLPEADEL